MTKTLNDIRSAFLSFFEGKGHDVRASSSLVPNNDPTLMFTNAGMVPFKNVFSGAETITNKKGEVVKRAASSQKCVRAGGKHNDLDNVGYTARHHTFFEMLGNFSFGDYFKEGAIEYAWELLTKTLAISPDKLWITVYHNDDEAFNIWKKITGFPDNKIIRIATNDNFWAMGDTGPCGPCSEIFYDHGAHIFGGPPGSPEADGDRFVEIWNLVFMQFEQLAGGKRINLPKPCIDTGSGLERVAAVMQGVHDNYETDLFRNLISASKEFSKNNDVKFSASHRVITDHLRASGFLLADGVMPSNEGRGYVLRRIMRRAMRHAHILGCKEPLMYKLVPSLIKEMGGQYSELTRAEALITETLKLEEERFKETLERGLKLLEEETAGTKNGGVFSGETAFKLYDTFGFPLDLTQDILRAKNIAVDLKSFESAMQEQKTRARAAWAGSGDAATEKVWFDIKEREGATEFLGYKTTSGSGKIIAIVKDGKEIAKAKSGDEVVIITNQTPFYAESGGQAGDKGMLKNDGAKITVSDTKKMVGDLHAHISKIENGDIAVGDTVNMNVDEERRNALRANHSATHLLHAALRKYLGEHVTQKGSLVEADSFRFDFSHSKGLSPDEITKIEEDVNRIVAQNSAVATKLMTPDEAVKAGAMALFGEKYGSEVRVLSMGDEGGKSYSIELCGGTHVGSTGEIKKFKIVKESSVASGIRRIEAVTASGVDAYIEKQKKQEQEEIARKKKQEQEMAQQKALVGNVKEQFISAISNAETVNGIKFLGQVLENVPAKDLRGLVDEFKKISGSGVVVIVANNEGRASIVVGVSDDLTAKISAVTLVQKGSEALGGKGGGGRPDFAQAGGPDAKKADEAINLIKKSI